MAAGGGTLISGTPPTEQQLVLACPQGCHLDKPAARLLAVNVWIYIQYGLPVG
jgi:hypothetical protein